MTDEPRKPKHGTIWKDEHGTVRKYREDKDQWVKIPTIDMIHNCEHAGEEIGLRECYGCGLFGRMTMSFKCFVHGTAAMRKVLDTEANRPDKTVECCLGCPDIKVKADGV